MAKFVRIHKSGVEGLINLDEVTSVIKTKDGKTLCVIGGYKIILDETYEQICKIIGSAQSGIPMEGSRMY